MTSATPDEAPGATGTDGRLQPAPSLLISLARAGVLAVAVALTSAVFALVKGVFIVLRYVEDALAMMHIPPLLDRRPLLSVLLSPIAVMLVPITHYLTAVLDAPAAMAIRVVTLAIVATFLAHSVPKALASPASLEQLRERLYHTPVERWFARRMRHDANAIWVRFFIVLSFVGLPAFVSAVLPVTSTGSTLALWVIVVLLANNHLNVVEHANAHYDVFGRTQGASAADRRACRIAAAYAHYVFPLLYARTPQWYKVQHVYVHHAEDNGVDDTQSTLPYDRASFSDFARCANKFALSGLLGLDVGRYLVRKRRRGALTLLLGGVAVFYSVIGLIALVNWRFAVAAIVVKYASLVLTALGFFQEHGMVDTTQPQNVYRNSLHFLAADNSHGSLGDDVHIEHHIHPGADWSGYVAGAAQDAGQYEAESALAFRDGPGGLHRYYESLWRRDFIGLASLFTVFGRADTSTEDVAELLWLRTRPLSAKRTSRFVERVDRVLGTVACHLLPDL
jgi:hypothetical protein